MKKSKAGKMTEVMTGEGDLNTDTEKQTMFFNDGTWMLTVVIFLLTLFLALHYNKVKSLPPGPFPLPIFGNLLAFKSNRKPELIVEGWRKIYGDVFTVWLGSVPYVVVCSWEMIRDALVVKKSDFSGRLGRKTEEMTKDGRDGILSCDYGSTWKILRKISQSAIRKYAVTDKFARIVCETTDDITKLMHLEKGAFDPSDLLELAVVNIMASSVFGKRYSLKDEEFAELRHIFHLINSEIGTGGNPADFLPFLRIFYRQKQQRIVELGGSAHALVDKKLQEHLNSYVSGDIRDLTDTLIAAREEAELDAGQKLPELKDGNLLFAIIDLFLAGIQTTYEVLRWTMLLISYYPEIQEQMRNEIKDAIGDRMPQQEDKERCPFTMAVITEVLRYRPPLSFGIPHKAIKDSQIGPYKIPKDTGIACLFENCNRQWNLWDSDPNQFHPERFLDKTRSHPGYVPFGAGQRKCPGEKMALADLFLLVCRLCQNSVFTLEGGAGSADLETQNYVNLNNCKPYKVYVTPFR